MLWFIWITRKKKRKKNCINAVQNKDKKKSMENVNERRTSKENEIKQKRKKGKK